MRATKVMGAEPGSVPIFQLYGTSTKADVYKIQVTTAGPSGTAKITITSQGDDNVAAGILTHGSPFALGTSGVSVVIFFDYLRVNDSWHIHTRSTGEYEEPTPVYDNFPGTVRPSQVGEGLAIQGAYKTALAIILINEALSQPIDCRGYSSLVIDMPADWTAAQVGFHTSEVRGGTYSLLYDHLGDEVCLDVLAAGNYRHVDALKGISFCKLASIDVVGHASITQLAERKIIITMEA